ncbi:MAG: type II toxin-antitoxin system prevent-host-death family antitoxin [Candidatus Electrothrix sp. EH2]|nr:type II toxin-antitoxin system prevent-host-death family antitoxin [Candidatus Electrothrix sp. EH2]
MQATSKDLRFHTKKILDVARRGEEVTITLHGKPYARTLQIDG